MDKNLWWVNGVVYQIYPRSFRDTNNDGIGDIQGIIDKLDYLEDLGIDAIWLSPINPSPDVDFGYDISDYYNIDPKFGDMSSFLSLVDKAHRKGIRVILDLVLNHTSDQHKWFLESRNSRDNSYRDWYIWRDPGKHGGPPNNWASRFGGAAWELDQITGQYYLHTFYKEQPDLNWRNPAVQDEMLNIFRYWCEKGIDGFRLDVFNLYYKHPEFPNNPVKAGIRHFDRLNHIYDIDQPEMIPALMRIRTLLNSYPERYAVGETYLDSKGKAAKYIGKDLLHAAFNFKLTKTPWRSNKVLQAVLDWETSLPPEAWPTQVINNHDETRSATRFVRGEDDERLKVAAALLLTLRGTPYMYYGEEIGMRNVRIRRAQIIDPIGKYYWPFYKGRDGCRTPMQWDSQENAGFSQAKPWLPVHENYINRNVETQSEDPKSLFNFYKALIHARKKHSALREGIFNPLTGSTGSILAFLRETSEETMLVALNFSRKRLKLSLGTRLVASNWDLILSNRRDTSPIFHKAALEIEPEEALILKKVEKNI